MMDQESEGTTTMTAVLQEAPAEAMAKEGGGGKKRRSKQQRRSSEGGGRKARREYRLVSYAELPEYMKENEFILNHYRSEWPLLHAFLSVFSWHNESINIWTHLLGFMLFLGLTVWHLAQYFPQVAHLIGHLSWPISKVAENVSSNVGDVISVEQFRWRRRVEQLRWQEVVVAVDAATERVLLFRAMAKFLLLTLAHVQRLGSRHGRRRRRPALAAGVHGGGHPDVPRPCGRRPRDNASGGGVHEVRARAVHAAEELLIRHHRQLLLGDLHVGRRCCARWPRARGHWHGRRCWPGLYLASRVFPPSCARTVGGRARGLGGGQARGGPRAAGGTPAARGTWRTRPRLWRKRGARARLGNGMNTPSHQASSRGPPADAAAGSRLRPPGLAAPDATSPCGWIRAQLPECMRACSCWLIRVHGSLDRCMRMDGRAQDGAR